MVNLKQCPFCGCGEGNLYIVTVEQHGFDTVGIFCNGCKQTVILEENEWEGDNDQSRKKAIDEWNRRANDESFIIDSDSVANSDLGRKIKHTI